jgi:competence protein ComEA
VFEDQSQKLYENLVDRVNGLFTKKPFLSTIAISALVGLVVLFISLDYKKGEATVEVTQDGSVVASAEPDNREIKVDLCGAVKKPGVYTLGSKSRLIDLLALGGGFVSDVSSLWVSKNLNLSQSLADGEKIYIPFEWDVGGVDGGNSDPKPLSLGIINDSKQGSLVTGALKDMGIDSNIATLESSGSTQSKVNVNTASASDLDLLPGIGTAFAGRIVENRPYASFEEFKDKSGLSANLAESLKDLLAI